jgi:beta-glucosidase
MGENPYAEWYGDIHVSDDLSQTQTIAYKTLRDHYAQDEALVQELKARGYEVTTVFFSGRPLAVEALDHSDAFIAGFLPGSQGGVALADLLFAKQNINFEGRLPLFLILTPDILKGQMRNG